jgi:hypothetical protein
MQQYVSTSHVSASSKVIVLVLAPNCRRTFQLAPRLVRVTPSASCVNAPLPHQRESGNRWSAVARTPRHRIPGTSRWYVHRDTYCTAGGRRASRRGRAGDRGQLCGGRVIHEASVQRTRAPTAGMKSIIHQSIEVERELLSGRLLPPAPADITKCDNVSGSGDNNAAIRGSQKEELMKRAIMGVSAAAAIALTPLCIPPAQAHADDPCVSTTHPDAHQACIDDFIQRREQTQCDASPNHGQLGQLCG